MQNQPNRYDYHPSYTPYYQPTYYQTPQQEESKRLRKDGTFIGIMLLAMTLAMNLMFSVIMFFMEFISSISGETIPFAERMDNTTYLVMYAIVYAFDLILPSVLVAWCCKRRYFPLSPAKPVPPVDVFLGVLSGLGGCIAANFIATYVSFYLQRFGLYPTVSSSMVEDTPTSLILNLLAVAVLPALLEEMVYRGYVLRTLRGYGDWFAVMVSALMFGLMHGNTTQIPFAFMVGIILGWLYVMTDNIWLPVTVHFCNNAMSVLLSYLHLDMPVADQNLFTLFVFMAVGVMGVLSFVVLCVRRGALMRRLPRRSLLSSGRRWGVLLTTPAFLIAVVLHIILTLVASVQQ